MEMQLTKTDIYRKKDIEQRKALNAWAVEGFEGTVIAATGMGKSRCGVIAVGKTLDEDPDANGIVLVPTNQLQDQFEEEFKKWGYDHVLDRVDIVCYQSAWKFAGEHYTAVAADEVHLGLSPEHRKFFENNTWDRLLCMTATPPEEIEYQDILFEMAPMVYELTLDEAVTKGLVAPYQVVCRKVELTDQEKEEYKKANNGFVRAKYLLGQFNAFDRAKFVLSPQGKKTATPQETMAAVQFYRNIRARKKVVDHAYGKLSTLKDIADNNLDDKLLVFGGSNDFTDMLAGAVSADSVVFHSRKTKKQKEAALEAFKNGDKRILCSTKALNQGFDVPDANLAIICGLTSKSLTMIQRVGRIIRFKPGKVGRIICLYVADSQEEKWLKSSVKNLDNVVWE